MRRHLLAARAQQVSPQVATKNWKKLRTIPVGKSIHVKTAQAQVTCATHHHDQNTLTCTQNGNDLVFQRTEVQSIKVAHGRWEWLTSPWFVVPAFAGGVAGIETLPHGGVIGAGLGVVLLGFLLFAHMVAG